MAGFDQKVWWRFRLSMEKATEAMRNFWEVGWEQPLREAAERRRANRVVEKKRAAQREAEYQTWVREAYEKSTKEKGNSVA